MATFFCSARDCPRRWKKFRGRDVVRGPKCVSCGAHTDRLKPLKAGFGGVAVRDDYPEHFNLSLGMVIKSRRHKAAVMKERGLVDYEFNDSVGSQLVKERLRRDGVRGVH